MCIHTIISQKSNLEIILLQEQTQAPQGKPDRTNIQSYHAIEELFVSINSILTLVTIGLCSFCDENVFSNFSNPNSL